MTLTQFYGASSLDGFIATPDHDLGWLLQFGEIEGSSYPAFIRDVGVLAMGSHTYEWMLKHAIDAGQPWPYVQPTWVFSTRTLRAAPPTVVTVRVPATRFNSISAALATCFSS